MRNRKAHLIKFIPQLLSGQYICIHLPFNYTSVHNFLPSQEKWQEFWWLKCLACAKSQSLPPQVAAAAPGLWHQIGEIKPHSEARKKWEAGEKNEKNRTGGLRRNHLRWWKVRGRGNKIWVRKYVERRQKSRRWREMEKRRTIYSKYEEAKAQQEVKQLARHHSLKHRYRTWLPQFLQFFVWSCLFRLPSWEPERVC